MSTSWEMPPEAVAILKAMSEPIEQMTECMHNITVASLKVSIALLEIRLAKKQCETCSGSMVPRDSVLEFLIRTHGEVSRADHLADDQRRRHLEGLEMSILRHLRRDTAR